MEVNGARPINCLVTDIIHLLNILFNIQVSFVFTFTFIYLAKAFIQKSDLQLLYMSEVARLWSN